MGNQGMLAQVVRLLFYGAVGLLFISTVLEVGILLFPAIALFGVSLVAAGIQARRDGYSVIWKPRAAASDTSSELPTSTWGLVFILIGLTVLGFVFVVWWGLPQRLGRTVEGFLQTELGGLIGALILCGVGIFWGLSALLQGVRGEQSFLRFVISVPGRLFGLIILVASVAAALAILVRLFAPQTFEGWLAAFGSWLQAWLNGE